MVSPCLCWHMSIVGLKRICLPKWSQSGYTTGLAREKALPCYCTSKSGLLRSELSAGSFEYLNLFVRQNYYHSRQYL